MFLEYRNNPTLPIPPRQERLERISSKLTFSCVPAWLGEDQYVLVKSKFSGVELHFLMKRVPRGGSGREASQCVSNGALLYGAFRRLPGLAKAG